MPRARVRLGGGARYTWTCCRPATTPAPRARTSRPGWRWRRRADTAERGRRWCGQSAAGGARPGLLSPVRNCLQSRADGCAGQHPRGRALSWRHGGGGGLAAADRSAAERQAHPGGRRRPERSVGGLSPGAARPHGEIHEAGPVRRHAAFRHSGLSPAARRSDGARSPASKRWACASCSTTRSTDLLAETRAGRFDAVFVAIGARRRQARRYSGARCGAGARCGGAAARHGNRGNRRCSAAGWWFTAVAIRRWMPRAPRAGWAPTRR